MKIEVVYNKMPRIGPKTHRLVKQVVEKTTRDLESSAKARAPVDTGALRNSITSEFPQELTGEVSVGVEYGAYVEYGTGKMAAQPYLTPAADQIRQPFIKAIERAIEEGANG